MYFPGSRETPHGWSLGLVDYHSFVWNQEMSGGLSIKVRCSHPCSMYAVIMKYWGHEADVSKQGSISSLPPTPPAPLFKFEVMTPNVSVHKSMNLESIILKWTLALLSMLYGCIHFLLLLYRQNWNNIPFSQILWGINEIMNMRYFSILLGVYNVTVMIVFSLSSCKVINWQSLYHIMDNSSNLLSDLFAPF